jgi:hypothetical protein
MGRIYTSTDSGLTWKASGSPIKRWRSVASSADGTKLVAGSDYGTNYSDLPMIYASTNSGTTWQATTAPNQTWQTIASSGDGTKLAAGVNGGLIYISTNSGLAWTPANTPSRHWGGIASSTNGGKLAAASSEGQIYVSTDSGRNWTTATAPVEPWQTIASSADGTRLAAAVYDLSNGGIYVAIASPSLSLTVSQRNAILTWPASVTGFTLQQTTDLSRPAWTDVTVPATVINGNNQATLPASSAHCYFRLIHRS